MTREVPPHSGSSGNILPFTNCDTSSTFDVLLETSKGSRIRYEFDYELKALRCKYILEPGLVFPIAFGSFPNSMPDADQQFQAVLLEDEELKAGCVFEAKVLGSVRLRLHNGSDNFVIIECALVAPTESITHSDLKELNQITMVSKLLIQRTYLSFPLQRQDFEVIEWCDSRKAIYHLRQTLEANFANFAHSGADSGEHQ